MYPSKAIGDASYAEYIQFCRYNVYTPCAHALNNYSLYLTPCVKAFRIVKTRHRPAITKAGREGWDLKPLKY